MPDSPNERISKAMNPARDDPEVWFDCPGTPRDGKCCRGITSAHSICPTCHGKGKVAVDWGDPAQTLRLVEWAAKQAWWKTKAIFSGPYAMTIFRLQGLIAGSTTAQEVAEQIRDILAAALPKGD